jgi:hypothetical protein
MTSLLVALLSLSVAAAEQKERVLDNFETLAPWQVHHTDDVSATLSPAPAKSGNALRLTFDFTDKAGNPINGYATARRELPLDFAGNFELSFWVRGEAGGPSRPSMASGEPGLLPFGPSRPSMASGTLGLLPFVNTLQFKLVDASGANVWWINRPDFTFTRDWQQVRVKKRDIEFAWGPTADRALRHTASIEFVVSSGRDGGKGTVEFDELTLRPLPPQDDSPLTPARVSASSSLRDAPAAAAFDGDRNTAWRSDPAKGAEQTLDIDLGKAREFSAIVIHWRHGEAARSWSVQQSVNRKGWDQCSGAFARSGDTTSQELCSSEARFLRVRLDQSEGRSCGIDEIEIKDPVWAKTRNAFFGNVAKESPRGAYPRGFVEQPYWTIVGVDGGKAPALISEDGAIEPIKGEWSIEPFLIVGDRRITWADVKTTQSLLDGYLPIPAVHWDAGALKLDVETFARGTRDAANLVVRYRVTNASDAPVEATLQLGIRPFQVNPPAQFLNSPGGVAFVRGLQWDGDRSLRVNDATVRLLAKPDDLLLLDSDGSSNGERLRVLEDGSRAGYDERGQLSAALAYPLALPAHGEREIDLIAPIAGAVAAPDLYGRDAPAWAAQERDAVATQWRERLDRVRLHVPRDAQRLADALRTAHAHMLISRDGPALRPGTRSYARSWIRDGAMIEDALLQLGDLDAARDYVDWYAPHQFANGKVPCCVDHRGSDPVPENDSHGELIHAIAQLYRYGGDRAQLEKNWPHVAAAIAYMDTLRAQETGADDPAFKGLMPASISHEGYSAKPMHSYWDDSWALAGYKDAVDIARALGKSAEADRIAQARDAFAADLQRSIATAVHARAIDFLPGCAELGDFDPTSTTIALAVAGEQSRLPQDLLHDTFDRYWRQFAARADGTREWNDYTPYEWRGVGAFVRLGQRERAHKAIEFFFKTGARPLAWNQWAEVVGRDPRAIRFIGDMPHAWVASDFVRSVLDLFAYERDDHALVLAGGIPGDWLDGEGVAIERLRTPYGALSYSLKRDGRRMTLRVDPGASPPGGFAIELPAGEVRVNGKRAERTASMFRFAAGAKGVDVVVTEE